MTGLVGPGFLAPPATAEEIDDLEAVYGHPLPEAVRSGWLRHNGQHDDDYGNPLFGSRWLSVQQCLNEVRFHQDETGELPDLDQQDYAEADGEHWESVPPGAVRLYTRHPAPGLAAAVRWRRGVPGRRHGAWAGRAPGPADRLRQR